MSNLPIRPCYYKAKYFGPIRPVDDVTDSWDIWFIMMCSFTVSISTIYVMPVFTPNEYMAGEAERQGREPWEIFANSVREAMAETGGFKLDNSPIRNKLAYADFAMSRKDEIVIDGFRYTINDLNPGLEL